MEIIQQPVPPDADWLTHLRAGRAFGGMALQSSSGTFVAQIQLFNPAASGIAVLLYMLTTTHVQGGVVRFGFHDTALPTGVTTVRNLLRGGSAPVATMLRTSATAVAIEEFTRYGGVALLPERPIIQWICELGESTGINVQGLVATDDIEVSFLWVELPT